MKHRTGARPPSRRQRPKGRRPALTGSPGKPSERTKASRDNNVHAPETGTKDKQEHQHNQSKRRESRPHVQIEHSDERQKPSGSIVKKNWLHDLNTVGPHWISAVASVFMVAFLTIQTCYIRESIDEGTEQFNDTIKEIKIQSETLSRIFVEQQRARLSFRIEIEEIEVDGETVFRIVCPMEIGGTTEARHVRFKNYVSSGEPMQRRYIASADVDWESRVAHDLSDVSPTEVGRQFVADPLSPQQLATIVSEQSSLYFIARLEYCDIYDECRYFMRCAELDNGSQLVTYCGTSIGDLIE